MKTAGCKGQDILELGSQNMNRHYPMSIMVNRFLIQEKYQVKRFADGLTYVGVQ